MPQAHVALPMLNMLRLSLGLIAAAPQPAAAPRAETSSAPRKPRGILSKVAAPILKLFGGSRAEPETTAADKAADKAGAAKGTVVDGTLILDTIQQSPEIIDRVLPSGASAVVADGAKSRKSIEDHPEVLGFLQNMMGDALGGNAEMISLRAREIPRILLGYGIRSELFRPDEASE